MPRKGGGRDQKLPYQSSLERHPDIVQAIGMVTIEVGNLDVMLGDVLAVLLNKPRRMGQVIYHATRGEMGRIAIIKDVVAYMFEDVVPQSAHAGLMPLKGKLKGWLKRAEAVVGKRHEMIHSNWGLDSLTLAVTRSKQPVAEAEQKAVKIEDLHKIITDIRILITEIHESIDDVHQAIWPKSSGGETPAR